MSNYYLCPGCRKCDAYNAVSGFCICLNKFDIVVMPVVSDCVRKPGDLCPNFEQR